MNRIARFLLSLFVPLIVIGCASDGWYAQQSREKFIRLPVDERNKERERIRRQCIDLGISFSHIACQTPGEPTAEEKKRLKNKDSWSGKIRFLYYGIW